MKKLKVILFTVFIISLLLDTNVYAVSADKWMEQINNEKYLSEISIPGTHDSGALYEPVIGTAKCQNLSIEQQLNIGVRYLDIRCREFKDSFTIHHGSIYQHLNFDDVINTCIAFLKNNPTETIVMSVKEEYNAAENTKDFEEVFDYYVKKNKGIWFLTDRIPKLKEARGKIVLLRRFKCNNSSMGINACGWKDNTTFTLNNAVKLSVQDSYQVGNNDNKWNAITNLYDRAKVSDNKEMFINYTSGYKSIVGIPNIRVVNDDINKRLKHYFNNAGHNKYGISVMDFVDENISRSIINTNF